MELNITRTRLAALTITGAAIDDASGWILLASVAAVVRARFDPTDTVIMVAETLAFALVMVLIVKPLAIRWARHTLTRHHGELSVTALAILPAAILLCAVATNLIGIFAIFGAFFLGAVLSAEAGLRRAVNRRLHDLVTAFFVPIFFTYTGLRTDIGTLNSAGLWLVCGLVLAAAIIGKFGGCGLAAWAGGLSRREAACVGALMNTRGLMSLVVINVGYDLGVIPQSVFCMLVLMALVTTLMTTPMILWLKRGTEL